MRACGRAPVLVVMHTVPGVIGESRSQLRKAEPHVVARLDVAHHRVWLEMAQAPGARLSPRMKDVLEALVRLPEALRAMYAVPEPAVREVVRVAGRPPAFGVSGLQPRGARRP